MNKWWGTFTLNEGECFGWSLADFEFYIQRNAYQLQIAQAFLQNAIASNNVLPKKLNQIPSTAASSYFFNSSKAATHITLIPILANRSQVSRPEIPFYIAAHEQIVLYISSPVWVRISSGKSLRILQEIPSKLLSDTWFGEDTLEGELCYSNTTKCAIELADVAMNSSLVFTEVTISNNRSENLLVQRIKLPLPLLSVFANAEGNLWTEKITIEALADHKMITTIEKSAPKFVEPYKLLSNPRINMKSNKILDFLSQIL